jgi:hypothetical protein
MQKIIARTRSEGIIRDSGFMTPVSSTEFLVPLFHIKATNY